MEDKEKFFNYVALLSLFVGAMSILEIFNPNLFAEFFMRISENVGWILGLTVGMVVPYILSRIKSHAFGRTFSAEVDERFVIFLANAALLAFVVSFARGIVVVFLRNYFEYFHIIITQWLIIVYLWFKFVNGFKISWRYIITTEIILIIFTATLLLWLK